jgi:steroid delta-isomerase-like uncharacterized protein
MNAAWATEWLSRFSTGDPTPLMDLYTDDARFEDLTLGRKVDGKLPLRGFFADFMDPAARENLFTFIAYSGDAHGGAVEWLWRAKHKRDLAGLPAQGKETSVRGVLFSRSGRGRLRSVTTTGTRAASCNS